MIVADKYASHLNSIGGGGEWPRPRLKFGNGPCCKSVKLFLLPEHFPTFYCFFIIYLLANLNTADSSTVIEKHFNTLKSENTNTNRLAKVPKRYAGHISDIFDRQKRTVYSRCDRSGIQKLISECQPCDTSVVEPCVNGDIAENSTSLCDFQVEGYGRLEGCRFVCENPIILINCCDGFYLNGNTCYECPGGYSSPCNNNGICNVSTGFCHCHGNFAGLACELCDDGYYGNTCSGECSCVQGVCDAGIDGTGVCSCFPHYQGINCSERTETCIAAGCHANASCRPIQGSIEINCTCNHGYIGDGYNCQEIDPCVNHNCSINANCYHTGRLQYNCTCKDNYNGDGTLCHPDNPCSNNNGGCPLEMSVCHYLSAGKSKCECIVHYKLNDNNICELEDLCLSTNASSCPANTECYMVTPGQMGCRCKPGYVGTHTCYGNIMQRLRELNINTEGTLYGQLTTGMELLEIADLGVTLSSLDLYFTLLIPNEDAFNRMDQQILEMARNDHEFAGYLMKLLIIPIHLDQHNLIIANHVYNLMGYQAEVKQDQDNVLQYNLESNIGQLVNIDLIASNGYIHVLDEAVFTTVHVNSNTSISLYKKISEEDNYQIFKKCLDRFEYFKFLDESVGPYTVFVPVNRAFENLTNEEHDFLLSDQGRNKLKGILENHIVPNAQVPIDTYLTQRRLTSLYGTNLDLFVSSRGEFEISSQSVITHTDVLARNGIVYEVSNLIIPDDLQPLVHVWCNTTTYEIIQGNCGSCIEPERIVCPVGTVRTTNETFRGCLFNYKYGDIDVQQEGCSLLCSQTVVTPACCEGFYGANCLPCPGGFLQPCLNNGQCSDGISGNGCCTCKAEFTGTSCELCANNNTYGAYCKQECTCLHGVCDNGIHGNGHCKGHCLAGYQGQDCQYQVQTCGNEYCHAHAECEQDLDGGVIRCVCLYGYEEVGPDCIAINYCSKPTQHSCSPQAKCVYDGPGIYHCECEADYAGDGFQCSPIDPCTLQSRGNCHQHSVCVYTAPGQNICECAEGYIGNGYDCSPSTTCTDACHPQALCEDVEGVPHCVCHNGYHGDGIVCYSNIAIEIAGNPLLNNFNELLTKSSVQHELAGIVNYTVFAAEDDAFQDLWPQSAIISNHVVRGVYHYSDVKGLAIQEQSLVSLNNRNISLRYSNMSVYVNEAKIVINNEPAVNGIIHIINQVFISSTIFEPTPVTQTGPGNILHVLSRYPKYSRIRQMLNETGISESLQELDSYTMFIPSNSALMDINLTEADLKYSTIGRKLHFVQLVDGLQLETLLGHNYDDIVISVINSSMVLVNRIALTEVDIETDKGVLHGVEAAIPIYRSRCDTLINITTKTLACCSGFYGESCNECPGGWAMPCSNHGNCSEDIMGTGECNCEVGFHGFACELCEDNLFGENCNQVCNCSHGECNSGREGDGQCICYAGWTGSNCDNADINGTCTNCHTSAYCYVSQCVCSFGFSGNGTYCEAVSLCDVDNDCSQNAVCMSLPQGGRNCSCIDGYYGDGIVCQEINPCLHDHGGCHQNADCIHTGPNKNICNCKTNFTGDGINSCRWQNPCSSSNGNCSIRATCQLTGANIRTCTCFEGHVGDGFNCIGNVAEELALNSQLSTFNRIIQTNALHHLWLSVEGSYTILAPHNSAFDKLHSDQVEIWQENDQIADIVDYLTIGCAALNVSQLEKMMQITTTNGQKLKMALINSGLLLNDIGKVISSIEATNGIIHIIDTVLTPEYGDMQNSTLRETLLWNNYTTLIEMMKFAGMFETLENPLYKPFTLFAPTNQAFNNLPADKKHQLENNVEILGEYLRFHVLADKKIRLSEMILRDGSTLATLQGSSISAGCGQVIGDGYVNMEAMILQSNIMFADGVVFGIDAVLDLPSIGGRCDDVTYNTVKSPCQDCAVQFTCPEGYKVTGNVYRDCYYSSGWYQTELGCRVDCVQRYVLHRCCENFYGRDCFGCPGGSTPCNNHGECNDGIESNGTCNCYDNYRGDACQSCQPEHYGPQCTVCACSAHGICEDGILGSGSCFCLEGWTGTICNEQLQPSPVCNPPCHNYAVCRYEDKCDCLPQYDGNGRECTEKDTCSYLNGGCSSFATCLQSEGQVVCTCVANYEGNGWTCNPVNSCSTDNGGCHKEAQCTHTAPNQRTCSCILPYLGDGFICEIPTSTPSNRGRCSSDNGGCSENADCHEIPPTESNPYGSRQCICRDGYVGNGTLCNGNVYDTLATIPEFSQFYRAVVDYGMHVQQLLVNPQSKVTVFVPINSDSFSSEQLNDGNHVVSGILLTSDLLAATQTVNAYSGLTLNINFKTDEKTVNNVIVKEVDIPATNGVLHVLMLPLTTSVKTTTQAYPETSVTDGSMSSSRLFAGILISFTVICVIGITSLLVMRYNHLKKVDGGFTVSKFKKKNNADGGVVYFSNTRSAEDNAFVNPSFSEVGEESLNFGKSLGTVSDA
ncbi:stabilin-2-like [Antedon mediterranea]|uniref:stabilin-2-like n=1 Tax=Antedon mediterranea TaxID=105859 RepID=UPI003AF85397